MTTARRALLAQRMARAGLTQATSREPAIPPRTHPHRAPLSFAQARAWEHQRDRPGSVSNNLCLVLTFSGTVDEHALARAFERLVERHEILRTTYHTDPDGQPYQWVHPVLPARTRRVARVGAGELDQLVDRAATEPFDLAAEGPLRLIFARLSAEELAVVLVIQHIAWDSATFGVLCDDLRRHYVGESPEPPPLRYGDFAEWERARWSGPDHGARSRSYWLERLSPPPRGTHLPLDRPLPPRAGERGGRVDRWFPGASAALGDLAARHRTTPFTVLAGCWAALLQRSGSGDGGDNGESGNEVTVGTLVAARDQPGTEEVFGDFGNILVLRLDTSGDPPFGELLRRADRELGAALGHQDYPFQRVVTEAGGRRPCGTPAFFDSLLVFVAQHTSGPRLPGATTRWRRADTRAAQFPLVPLGIEVFLHPDGLEAQATYRRDVLDAATVRRLLQHLQQMIVHVATAPGTRLSALPAPQ